MGDAIAGLELAGVLLVGALLNLAVLEVRIKASNITSIRKGTAADRKVDPQAPDSTSPTQG